MGQSGKELNAMPVRIERQSGKELKAIPVRIERAIQ
jgi:hypothetical protein